MKGRHITYCALFMLIGSAEGMTGCSSVEQRSADERGGEDAPGVVRQPILFGTDDRLEYGQVAGTSFQRWGDSTAIMTHTTNVSCAGGTCNLTTKQFTDVGTTGVTRLCDSVRVKGQTMIPDTCSGFLVGPQTLVTAGHCVVDDSGIIPFSCSNTSWIFGFVADANGGSVPTSVPDSNVYHCVSATGAFDFATEDWAIVTLDRPVSGRAPLNVRHSGEVTLGEALSIIGYPAGLAMKIAPNGVVKGISGQTSFTHNVDAYSGDSGAPVFDVNTGVVEGIHVAEVGSAFSLGVDLTGACWFETTCPDTGCPGSPNGSFNTATRITHMSAGIPLTPALILTVI